MSKPLLQVALDHLDIPSALEATRALADEVDVLEMGTILCYAEGSKAVGILRALYPEKTIVADLKAADAGGTVAEIVFSQGANWMTVICNAPYATMEAALEVARKYNGDLQIELYGDWTFDHARKWREIGLTQAIYHRGRDAGLAGQQWGEEDLEKIRKLADMGFEVSVTGGL
ncbi:MAG: 3-keto-L-gulonate-6-phosphate decarboxylase, partial [Desulfofustis sp.]|nr:3-keto-L-gulonate-6-phosphate decarboxylase [Desulfofustis sp.]